MIIPPPNITLGIGAEIIYSFVIIVCSLMIYFGTKKIYELSSYKGIKYFRQAFLLFAIAYFFRFLIEFVVISFNTNEIFEISPIAVGYFAVFIFMYLSSISIFYLIYSISWKKLKSKSMILYLFHIISIIIALVSVIFRNQIFYIGLNIILLIYATFVIYFASRRQDKSKRNSFYFAYILLLIFWVLNVLNIFVPVFFDSLKLFIYLTSLCIFLVILYKVLKKSGD
ncbi:MAG: hypothetical protein WAU65_00685 [Candidatus Nanoarchaeia archaeon]